MTSTVLVRKTVFRAVLPALLILSLLVAAVPAEARKNKSYDENNRYAALVIDASTGQVFYEKNADKPLHPASLTKIMTLLMVFEALEQGRLSLRDRIYVSKYAAGMPASKLGLQPGSSIRVQDAIYALVTLSANDVSAAIGEHLGGSERGFARMMTARAQELGMQQTRFVNASGLNNPQQITSARDMATLARFVITTYPHYYRYFSRQNFSYGGRNYNNHNRLMEKYPGMDGMKTGYVAASGFNLVASAVRNDRRLIGVVFGGRSAQSRNDRMAGLLDAAFAKARALPSERVLMASATQPAVIPEAKPKLLLAAAADAPVPPRKPGLLIAAGAINKYAPAAFQASADATGIPNLLSGIEPAGTAPAETLASAAGNNNGSFLSGDLPAWAVQVGAFSSRAATDKALHDSMKKLPVKYASLNPIIAPLKTQDGWVFRARLHGLSEDEVPNVCRYLADCVAVAPRNN